MLEDIELQVEEVKEVEDEKEDSGVENLGSSGVQAQGQTATPSSHLPRGQPYFQDVHSICPHQESSR
jgi:hypothetical protein